LELVGRARLPTGSAWLGPAWPGRTQRQANSFAPIERPNEKAHALHQPLATVRQPIATVWGAAEWRPAICTLWPATENNWHGNGNIEAS